MISFRKEIGIDLGTSSTRVCLKRGEIVLDEATMLVVTDNVRRSLRAIGENAMSMVGRTAPDEVAIRPLRQGRIKEFELAEDLLRYFIRKSIGASYLFKPKALISIPCGLSPIDRRVLRDAALKAGIQKNSLHLIEKPFASALGADLDIFSHKASMVIDIGGGTTEIGLIASGGFIGYRSIAIGGVAFDEAIMSHIQKQYNMLIGDRVAENIKIDRGSAVAPEQNMQFQVRGREMTTGLPRIVDMSLSELWEVLCPLCSQIADNAQNILKKAPPEAAADVLTEGVVLTGGGSLLSGFESFMSESLLGMPVHTAREPDFCCVKGLSKLLDNDEHLAIVERLGRFRDEEVLV
ncbi:MAG TPA: rod shape-determining protein [Clostridiales bacterium]|jgi:rod shape-determining protein MreB|nr:rod shape-determining protein [Clostridiales bacterium]